MSEEPHEETPHEESPQDARFRDLLSRQLVHNEEAWTALVAHGVTERTPLVLEFAFEAPDAASAAQLVRVLEEETDYDVGAAPEGDAPDARWTVAGATRPVEVSAEILDAWAEWMVTAGLQQGADFVGWRTSA